MEIHSEMVGPSHTCLEDVAYSENPETATSAQNDLFCPEAISNERVLHILSAKLVMRRL